MLAVEGTAGSCRAAADQPHELAPHWRRWIAENVMLGVDRAAVLHGLLSGGIERSVAEAEIQRALESPYVAGGARLVGRINKRDWLLANLAKLEALAGIDRKVPRRAAIDPKHFFDTFYFLNRPVILSGMIGEWPATRSWSLDYFEAKLGDPIIELQFGRTRDADYEQHAPALKRRVPFSSVIGELREDVPSNDFYITANNGAVNRTALAPLWEDIGLLPGILETRPGQDGFFWLGPRGTITPWHHDLTNNLLVQIRGRKRVTLASPSQTPRMRNHTHCYSGFGGEADLSHLSDADRPRTVTCEIGPGDILFLPIGWWHHVEALDMSISLSFTNFAADNDFCSYYVSGGVV